ncbi:MAG: DNA recombination protein RmuC [bacterium]|nr:DNA recombination protein RmuC [bacterium]
MTSVLYIIIGLLLVGFGILLFLLLSLKRNSDKPQDNESMRVMMEWMKEIKSGTEMTRENMQKSIDETNKAINERLDNAAKVIGGLQGKLGEMTQIGPDIRRLSEVLASPKARGNFGEEMLENMLSQVLNKNSYKSQYKFNNGEIVDMAVFVGEKILSIDSKFSMENFRLYKQANEDDAAENLRKAFLRDIKKRIDEIHKKYILPQEKTFDFALMYIPSEGVFHEALEDAPTIEYARNKKVYLVSPNTLYHHLQIILIALRGQQVNEVAEKLLHMVSGVKQESDKFGRSLGVLSNHIKNASNTMGTVGNDFIKLQTSISNAASLQMEQAEVAELAAGETKNSIN